MKERLLRVTAPHFCAGIVFQKQDGERKFQRSAPILGWLRDKSPLSVRLILEVKGWGWEWVKYEQFAKTKQSICG